MALRLSSKEFSIFIEHNTESLHRSQDKKELEEEIISLAKNGMTPPENTK